MNALSNFSAKQNLQSLPSLNYRRPVLARPISSLSFTTPPPRPPYAPIKASSSSSPDFSAHKAAAKPETINSKPENPTQLPFEIPFSLIKCAAVTAVAAAAVFLGRNSLRANPAIAASVSAPATEETGEKEAVSSPAAEETGEKEAEAETETLLVERLLYNPNDVKTLKNLLEAKIQNREIDEAIRIIDKLIELEPSETEWPLLKNHFYVLNGDFEMAKNGFNEILAKDPLRVEAYHGLITAISDKDDEAKILKGVEKRILAAMEICKDRKGELRDFKLLLAQIRGIEGEYEEAIKVYQELVKEEPRDFRPYLSQALMYTLLGKENEAQTQYQTYLKLLPKGHPYASFLDDSMTAAKFFAAKKKKE